MLLYEYRIRDQLERLSEYARNVYAKFESGATAEDLLRDSQNLRQVYDSLKEMLPIEIRNVGDFGRHVSWMISNLSSGRIRQSEGDIHSICNRDIDDIEKAFRTWCGKKDHYDKELAQGVSDLVLRHEYDSAVRKAFVILKSRLVKLFGVPANLDGPDLVNHVFGKSGSHGLPIDDSERQAFRDLLAGLYGVFRNKYAHNHSTPSWAEMDAILSMVNFVLKELDHLTKRDT